jgi:hypothetical protein
MKINELHNQPVQADTYEASMALNQLLKIGKHAIKIHNMIDDDAEMEAWVAKKIDLAGDYVKKVHGYMQGEKAGLYDDGGLTEDAGEQALANELSKYYQDSADGYDPEDKGNDEHEEAEDIAQAFKKGLQAGMDEVNMSKFEFSGNYFDVDQDGRGEVHPPMADLLKKYGVSAGINKKGESYLIKDGKAITDPGHWNKEFESFPEEDEMTFEDDDEFFEAFGYLGFPEDENELFDAEYRGRKVPLNKPMRGDVKKFKVYVKDPKSGNVKKVNFGHGGSSARKAGQKTMKIRKSNPKARKSFRARHNCANPGPKTKARYWSCRKW